MRWNSGTGCLCLIALTLSCATRHRAAGPPRVEPGQALFQSYCAACHQYDGQGAGSAPPLDNSVWVKDSDDRLIKIVLHGVRGPMVVSGRTYELEMPGFGAVLPDDDVAALLRYLRGRFGGNRESVTPESVRRVRNEHRNRTEYWTAEDLLRQP